MVFEKNQLQPQSGCEGQPLAPVSTGPVTVWAFLENQKN